MKRATYERGIPTGGPIQSWDRIQILSKSIPPQLGPRYQVKELLDQLLRQGPKIEFYEQPIDFNGMIE